LNAVIGPLAVDGLMVVCGFALLAISRHKAAADEAAVSDVVSQQSDIPTDTAPDTTPAVAVNEGDMTADNDRDMTAVVATSEGDATPDFDAVMSPDNATPTATSDRDTTAVEGDIDEGDMTPDNVRPLPVADEVSRDMKPVGRRPRVVATDDHTDRARRLLADDPDIKGAELGRRLGLSERQGQRLLATLRPVLQEVQTS
ncbi:hypothetical protein, partial [Actinocorallia aurantiaca]|uniref:hypothetical protein n=1 Tax=Actinocorallia aurantiaca TaxID=46204 RepID=UPI0031E2FB76